jgi:acyl-CoA synthetase (AMP-forming)/AMP-acid ligase II
MNEADTKADASSRPASRTLGDLVDEMAARRPAAEAIVFRDERLDYAALKARADAFARALLAVGVQHGDRVALLVTNRPEWIICTLAAAKIASVRCKLFLRGRECGTEPPLYATANRPHRFRNFLVAPSDRFKSFQAHSR